MKVDRKTIAIVIGIMIGTVCVAFGTSKMFWQKSSKVEEYVYISQVNSSLTEGIAELSEASGIELENMSDEEALNTNSIKQEVVYDGLTMEELSDKLNRSLHSTLANQGELIATYSLQVGVDPYLATAIMLHETGCSYNCSTLVTACNNVGGMKGGPSCGGGAYRYFSTLDEGIRSFLDNLANNYYAIGLTTPELINSRYAESTTWASKINTYINQIKST